LGELFDLGEHALEIFDFGRNCFEIGLRKIDSLEHRQSMRYVIFTVHLGFLYWQSCDESIER